MDLAARGGRTDRPRWGRDCVVDSSATVTRSVLWDRVHIGAGATIHECVVADDVHIPAGANYSRCAIAKGEAGLVVETLR
jgi:ADP-glucose pyrophosphorylase